jgi:hypothetical protein
MGIVGCLQYGGIEEAPKTRPRNKKDDREKDKRSTQKGTCNTLVGCDSKKKQK